MGKLISIYMTTNPLSHKCKNFTEPGQLRGDLDNENTLTISTISINKHYAIDIADPSSMQDACHMNFVINLAHRRVSVAQLCLCTTN